MPAFQYQVRDRGGQILKGVIETANVSDAARKLRDEGYYITSLDVMKDTISKPKISSASKVNLKSLLIFTRQFSVLIKAGVSLVTCLSLLAQQTEDKKLKEIIIQVRRDVEGGSNLYSALGKYPKVFPPIYIHMVEAGEAGGQLDTVLERLSEHFEREFELRKKVIGALTYPLIIAGVAVMVVIGLMVFVLPVFMQMFQDAGLELPLITKALMSFSSLLGRFWYVVAAMIIGGIIWFGWYRSTPKGRAAIDKFLYNMKIIGPVIQKVTVARFARILATLLDSGILITSSLEIVERAVANGVLAAAIAASRVDLTRGGGLAKPLAETKVFPGMVTQMIAIGEETGELSKMLNEVAKFYEKESGYAVEALTTMIEPMIVMFMGVVVGTIVISVALPMFELNSGATLR
jgi:type IV pilus assembly protein PilC